MRVAFSERRGDIHWVLSDRAVAVLTRELLYTGITRAKARFALVAPQSGVLLLAVSVKVLRNGGLNYAHANYANTSNIEN